MNYSGQYFELGFESLKQTWGEGKQWGEPNKGMHTEQKIKNKSLK